MTMRERRRPPRLRPGDTVAVVAPAGPVPGDLLEVGLEHLRSWGLHTVVGKHVRERHPQLGYLAGNDADRAEDLQQAWCDPQVSGVLCARGGYGSMRVLDHLDWAAMADAEPKVFAGSSDITALHDAFAKHLEMVTVFSPMPATKAFTEDVAAREHLRRTLFEPQTVTTLSRSAASALVAGRARGITYGGNLSIATGTLGSPDAPTPPEQGIAVLEDITEEPYRLDRFVTQLLRAGWFDRTTAIVLGSWIECGPVEDVRAMLLNLLGGLNVPIIWELGFGHCPDQYTIPLGVAAEVDTAAPSLTFRQPALL